MELIEKDYVREALPSNRKILPLREGETVTYMLCTAASTATNKIDTTTGTPVQLAPSTWSIQGRERVYNPEKKKNMYIQYVNGFISKREDDGSYREIPKVENITFNDGYLMVTSRNQELYAFLEASNKNESNQYRDQSVTPVFMRLDPAAKAQKNYFNENWELDARLLVRDADGVQIDAIIDGLPQSMKIDRKMTYADKKVALNELAKKSPSTIMLASKNPALKVKVMIRRAIENQILMFDDVTNSFISYAGREPETIFKIEVDENPDNAAEIKFTTDPSLVKHRDAIIKLLEKKQLI